MRPRGGGDSTFFPVELVSGGWLSASWRSGDAYIKVTRSSRQSEDKRSFIRSLTELITYHYYQ